MTEIATIAGGCFWCTEAIFKRLKGVLSVMPGYTGGNIPNPSYEDVCGGESGHAEGIQIEFNPAIISYAKLIEIFFHLHDPTTLNQQGADHGTQYRSAIFYHSEKQQKTAEEIKKKIADEKVYPNEIVTEITKFTNFYPADEQHQNFYEKNTRPMYCRLVIDPKIQKLLQEYKNEVA